MIIRDLSKRWLAYESSPVDWCEENYTVSSSIAEFTNTISNILLVLLPAIALKCKLWDNYTKHVTGGTKTMLYLLIVIGVGSAYFHATLSLLGQWLDEVGILFAICFGYSSFTPNSYRPKFLSETMAHVMALLLALTLMVTWFIAPYVNAFWLMSLTLPMFGMMYIEGKKETTASTVKLVKITLIMAVSAVTLWIADRSMCSVWLNLGIPGFHNIWHLLSAEVAYLSLTIFAYWKALYDKPYIKPTIRYTYGIPYVHCKDRMSS